ncbi:PTS transporter subunit EIIB [Klebsiella pneumoniae]|uniref:PTS transporter subunit EIIB n=1 Tax=Klebsiella pneumoniae TaxID=573 RepID=UPI002FEEF0B0
MSEQQQILSIIDNLGGRENIKDYYHCATRLTALRAYVLISSIMTRLTRMPLKRTRWSSQSCRPADSASSLSATR